MIAAVSAESLAVDRGGRRLFEELSVTLHAGQAIALTGPNGAGKTSLLRALAGLLRPAAGCVRFNGSTGPLETPDVRAAALHWLGSADGLNSARTAIAELRFWSSWAAPPPTTPLSRELALAGEDSREAAGGGPAGDTSAPPSPSPPLSLRDISPASRERDAHGRIAQALDALGLAPQARTEVRRLSTGQRRRLALARLLASPRPLWLLDEPLAPLDAAWRARVGDLMQGHLAAGGLLIAAVHDPLPIPARELRLESV